MNSDYSSDYSDNEVAGSGAMGSASGYGAGANSSLNDMTPESGERLRKELSSLKADLDALMAKASSLSDTELREARDRLMAQLEVWQQSARGLANQASEQFYHGMDVTSDYVKEKPLQSVAIAAGVGLLVGALLRR